MTEFTLTAICALCDESFEARTSYGLCPMCWERDKLREFDRVETAKRFAKRASVPVELTLTEWLGITTDFNGHCAYCLVQPFSAIEMVDPLVGLIKKNVVPICRACQVHKHHSFVSAEQRVRAYLDYDPTKRVKLNDSQVATLGQIFPGFDTWYHDTQDDELEDGDE